MGAIKIIDVTSPDINNGTGFRVSLWVSGCTHRCKGCHNRHTWKYNQGMELEKAIPKVVWELEKPYIKGLTITGGDPLDQDIPALAELAGFLKAMKMNYPDKDIWLYTGYVYDIIKDDHFKMAVIKECDVLVDGPFVEELLDRSLPFRGSSNQRIIDVKETLETGNVVTLSL